MKHSTDSKSKDRRKFLYWTAGAVSALMFWKFIKRSEKKERPVKMLTEDGQLVEVDIQHLTGKRRRAKIEEIQNWVNRKK
jgi:hypothetical protein